ncbi:MULTISPECIES: RcgR family putative quorum lactone hydrolase [Brucella]|uniref:Alpha/beta hydrolase family protein n=2 Tax=Brucella TaxID=234 RepID=A0A256FR32_9HYPH|nr:MULTISPECIES: dienelactone hydrolase-related enzyme [Brucella]KAB0567210.1 dienelactone hydrolase-related enzyme [Brucella pituitosa]OYR17208.1 alpha/beta hydrolase family protein [Brucella rhizosphaerae]TMU91381.1 dienelactone hydrolase-related enzyme [Brucella haematophila]
MFHSWLDQWDEKRARRGEDAKKVTAVILDAERAFPGAPKVSTIDEFCQLGVQAAATPSYFRAPLGSDRDFERAGDYLKFPSEISTDVEENNQVWAKITDSGSRDKALVIFHHWNARSRNSQIARYFSKRGITVVEIAMPYHFERSRPGSDYADYMLSANLGRTIQSLRQAVWDGQKLIRWLKSQGYREISVLGMSLGSWVAGLVAAHDTNVKKASLFLTAGSLAEMVWTGRATRAIRESFEPTIDLSHLHRAWAPLDLGNYAYSLARPDLDIQIVLAKRDKVVLPELSIALLESLNNAGVNPNVQQLNCGHYSLAIPPYIFRAGANLKRFVASTSLRENVP